MITETTQMTSEAHDNQPGSPTPGADRTNSSVFTLAELLTAHSRGDRSFVSRLATAQPGAGAFATASVVGLGDRIDEGEKVPSSTGLVVEKGQPTVEEEGLLDDILLLHAFISCAAYELMYKDNPKGWDITDPIQAADFIKKAANARFRVLTEGMRGFLVMETGTEHPFEKTVTSVDLHLEFLTELFGVFAFPEQALAELDAVLTSVVKELSNLKLSWSSQKETLDHLIFCFYFEKVAGLDFKLPRLKIFYLHIDEQSWEASVGKSSVKRVEFKMNYFQTAAVMVPEQVRKHREEIEKLLETMTDMSLDELNKILAPKVVKS